LIVSREGEVAFFFFCGYLAVFGFLAAFGSFTSGDTPALFPFAFRTNADLHHNDELVIL